MKKQWEQCKPGQKLGRWHAPQVTMDRRGDIQLSRVAWELLREPDQVLIFYDREREMIGIRPAHSQTPHHFPVLEHGRHGGRRIRTLGLSIFPRALGSAANGRAGSIINLTHTIRFKNPYLDEDGMLTLDLKTARPAYHGHRIGAFHNERKEKIDRRP